MIRKIVTMLNKGEKGFTLIEMLAAITIFSVISLAVLNVSGLGNQLIYREKNQMDGRVSARTVLTRIVKDITEAKQTEVVNINNPSDQTKGDTVVITRQDGTVVTYGFDPEKEQIYFMDSSNQITYLINAISVTAYTPLGLNNETTKKNQITMDITVSVGDSLMTFSDTVVVRSVNANSTPIPYIKTVAPNLVQFKGEEKKEKKDGDDDDDDGDDHDDDNNDDNDNPGNGVQTIYIAGQDTNFAGNTIVYLVPMGRTLADVSDPSKNVITFKNGTGNPVRTKTGDKTEIWIDLNRGQVIDTTYDVWATTPGVLGTYPEKAYKLAALTVHITAGTPEDDEENHDENESDDDDDHDQDNDDPDDDVWDIDDWVVNVGSINGFGTINNSTHVIEKKDNSNDKVAYYNHLVGAFDYQVKIDIEEEGSNHGNPKALLTIFGAGSGPQYTYTGFGIDESGYVYYGDQAVLDSDSDSYARIKDNSGHDVKVSTGTTVTLRAVKYLDNTTNQWTLKLYVNDMSNPKFTSTKIPSGTGYLGVTVTDNKMQAKFTVSRM